MGALPRLAPLLPAGSMLAALAAAVGVGLVTMRPRSAPVVGVIAIPTRKPGVDATPIAAIPRHPFGELTVPPKAESFPRTPRLVGVEMSRFIEAANFYRKNQFPQGDAAASAISDPIARAALDWVALRVVATPARLDAFERAHPDWPLADWRHALHEAWLFNGKPSPAETLDTLGGDPPQTAQGQIALARANWRWASATRPPTSCARYGATAIPIPPPRQRCCASSARC